MGRKRSAPHTSGRAVSSGWAAATLSTAAAVGLLVGLRAIVALRFPDLVSLLGVDTIPIERFAIDWSTRASWPVDAQLLGLERLLRVVASVVLACVAVASLNALVDLAEASSERRQELAIRSAIGAPPWALVTRLLRELRTLLATGLALGIVTGLSGGAVARLTWPSVTRSLSMPPLDLLLALSGLAAVLVLVHVSGVWHVSRRGRASQLLRTGSRSGADPAAIFVRSSLAACQVTIAATVLSATLALTSGFVRSARADGLGATGPWVVEVAAEGESDWRQVLAVAASMPGIEAESLAAPGALLGLGVRDVAVTQCGECVRGLFPAPLWSAIADHHVVAPGYFDLVGLPVVEGRDFAPGDGPDAEPVAIVNATFAHTSFDSEGPLGRKIRIGSDADAWYTIVGIVEDGPRATLGADGLAREGVYLSALQRPPRHARLVLGGTDEAAGEVASALEAGGYEAELPVRLDAFRAAADRPLRWSRALVAWLSLLVMVLAVQGIRTLSIQATRRRAGELALRRALGATPASLVLHVLGGRLRISLWGVAGFAFFGTLTMAFLQAAAGIEGLGVAGYAAIAGALITTAQLASLRAVREALAVEPHALLK